MDGVFEAPPRSCVYDTYDFTNPVGFAEDSEGKLWVADECGGGGVDSQIHVFDAMSKHQFSIDAPHVGGVGYCGKLGRMAVALNGSLELLLFSLGGDFMGTTSDNKGTTLDDGWFRPLDEGHCHISNMHPQMSILRAARPGEFDPSTNAEWYKVEKALIKFELGFDV